MSTTPRTGRRIAIALGVATTLAIFVLAWLGAPYLVDEWWIRKLRSSDEAEVRAAIARINKLRTLRAAPALLSIIGEWEHPTIDPLGFFPPSSTIPFALVEDSLRKLDRSPDWFASRIEDGSATERKAAIYLVGAMGWEAAVPALKAVVEGNGPLAPAASLALARILPIVRVEGSTIEKGSNGQLMTRVRLRITNLTSRSLWFLGASSNRPLLMSSASTKGPRSSSNRTFPTFRESISGPQEFSPGSSFTTEEVFHFSGGTLRFLLDLSHCASLVPDETEGLVYESWDAVTVESNAVEPPIW